MVVVVVVVVVVVSVMEEAATSSPPPLMVVGCRSACTSMEACCNKLNTFHSAELMAVHASSSSTASRAVAAAAAPGAGPTNKATAAAQRKSRARAIASRYRAECRPAVANVCRSGLEQAQGLSQNGYGTPQ